MRTEAEVRDQVGVLEQQAEHHRAQLNATLGALEMMVWALGEPETPVDKAFPEERGTAEAVTTNPEAEGPSADEVAEGADGPSASEVAGS